jgi:hypothetical protein
VLLTVPAGLAAVVAPLSLTIKLVGYRRTLKAWVTPFIVTSAAAVPSWA